MKRSAIAGIFLFSAAAFGQTQFEVLTDEIQLRPDGSATFFKVIDAYDPALVADDSYYGVVGTSGSPLYEANISRVFCDLLVESSDERLKENVQNLGPVLGKIQNIRTVTYQRKGIATSNRRYIGKEVGFLAQNLKESFPEVVRHDSKNDQHSVQYTRMVPVLIKAIQEQQAQIVELKAQIQALKK